MCLIHVKHLVTECMNKFKGMIGYLFFLKRNENHFLQLQLYTIIDIFIGVLAYWDMLAAWLVKIN